MRSDPDRPQTQPDAETGTDTASSVTAEPSATPSRYTTAWPMDAGAGQVSMNDWHRSSHWSVPWSDLMMVMFVLFAILLTLQMNETVNAGGELESRDQRPRPSFEPLLRINVFERSREAIRETRIDNVEIALMSDQSVKVSVQGPMFFELGKATLRPEVKEFLDRLAGVISQTPFAVQVIGHTDDFPVDTRIYPSNWELSAARAARVTRYLIDSASIDPGRFTVMGRGEFEPARPNSNAANRSLNRRVEIIITREPVGQPERSS